MARWNEDERALHAAALASFAGGSLQKIWLPSALQAVLQLRPGLGAMRTLLLLLDARAGVAVEVAERPALPEPALPAQASLRNALAGARLLSATLEREAGSKTSRLRLAFETPRGPRALLAEPAPRALLLLAAPQGDGERIAWTSADRTAGPLPAGRKPGAALPRGERVALPAAAEAKPRASAGLIAGSEAAGLQARKAALARQLKARIGKLQRTLAAVQADLEKARAAEGDRKRAELLLPHQGRVPRGARQAEVPDWSRVDDSGRPAQVTVALDPALSAAENAARWLRKAHRYQAAVPRIEARLDQVRAELAEAQELQKSAAAAADQDSLRAAEEEMRLLGGSPQLQAKAQGRRAPKPRAPFRTFRSTSGARILVGRNARGNDELTLRFARGNDLWMHARGLKGAHVVVPEPGESPDSRTLLDAALLAAHFSSARGRDVVEVAWTRRKHVRKPKGAAAGSVNVAQEKAIRVRPEPERLQVLLDGEVL